MNKLYIIFLTCLLSNLGNAQSLFEEGLELNYYLTHFTPFSLYSDINVNTAKVLGDTIILDQSCSVLSFDLATCDLRPKENYIKHNTDSILYYNEDLEQFKLLYDFTLEQDDTLKLEYWDPDFVNDSIFYVKVISVDSVMINNQLTKRMHVIYDRGSGDVIDFENFYLDAYWIQGLGSTNNFFHFSGLSLCDLRYNTCLISINHPSSGYYDFESCITSLEFDTDVKTKRNTVYPNPFLDELKISLTTTVSKIQIINLYGELIYQHTIDHNQKELLIENEFLPGIYFITFFNEHNKAIQTEKIVRMR